MISSVRVSAQSTPQDLDLLRGLPGLLDLNLLSLRSSAATQRVLAGAKLDSLDHDSLTNLASTIRSAAEVVEFFDSEGRNGVYPNGAFAVAVDVAVATALVSEPTERDSDQLENFMKVLASKIASFASDGNVETARELAPIFGNMSRLLSQKVATVGEDTRHF
jgi:hypothetical protein